MIRNSTTQRDATSFDGSSGASSQVAVKSGDQSPQLGLALDSGLY